MIDEKVNLWKALNHKPVDETDRFIELLIKERESLLKVASINHRIVEGVAKVNDHILEVAAEARNAALEEAIDIAWDHTCQGVCCCNGEIVKEIRKLRAGLGK